MMSTPDCDHPDCDHPDELDSGTAGASARREDERRKANRAKRRFVGSELPMLGKLSFNGYLLLHPKALAKRINADGALADTDVSALASELAQRFPSA